MLKIITLVYLILVPDVSADFVWQPPIPLQQQSTSFLANFSQFLYKSGRLEGVVLFIEQGVSTDSFAELFRQIPPLPTIVLKQQQRWNFPNLAQTLTSKMLAIIHLQTAQSPARSELSHLLKRRLRATFVFLVEELPVSDKGLLQFFEWCWQAKIVDAFLVAAHQNTADVWSYDPFPKVQLLNVSHQRPHQLLRNKVSNCRGYNFCIEVFPDPPHFFETPFVKVRAHHGYTVELIKQFSRLINATYRLEYRNLFNDPNLTKDEILMKPGNDVYPFGLNPMAPSPQFIQHSDITRPIIYSRVCIIVPRVPEIPRRSYLQLSLPVPNVYLFVMLLGILLVVQLLFNRLYRYGEYHIGLSIVFAVNTLLFQAFPDIVPKRTKWYRGILLLLAISGFMFANTFITTLTSLLSVTVPGLQLNSVNRILDSNLEIMVHEYDFSTYFESNLLPRELIAKTKNVTLKSLHSHRGLLNNSYGYLATTEQWMILKYVQHRLFKPRLLPPTDALCTPKVPMILPMQFDSPFASALDTFILHMHEHGLALKWLQEVCTVTVRMYRMKLFTDAQFVSVPLTLDHLLYGLCIYGGCTIITIFVFLGEILASKRARMTSNTFKL